MPDIRLTSGFLIAFAIGALCRLFGIPVPAPPALVGALVVVSMTSGYLLGDRLFKEEPSHREDCGGPMG